LGLFCGSEGVEEIEEKALRVEKAEGSEARPRGISGIQNSGFPNVGGKSSQRGSAFASASERVIKRGTGAEGIPLERGLGLHDEAGEGGGRARI